MMGQRRHRWPWLVAFRLRSSLYSNFTYKKFQHPWVHGSLSTSDAKPDKKFIIIMFVNWSMIMLLSVIPPIQLNISSPNDSQLSCAVNHHNPIEYPLIKLSSFLPSMILVLTSYGASYTQSDKIFSFFVCWYEPHNVDEVNKFQLFGEMYFLFNRENYDLRWLWKIIYQLVLHTF